MIKKEVQNIIEDNVDLFDNEKFAPAFERALLDGVATDLLNHLYEADVSPVPTEQLFDVLKEHYIDNNSKLTTEEKLAKAKFIQYLINKYQISIFESILNNQ